MSKTFKIPIQKIKFCDVDKYGIDLSMARVDLIHALASGNKIYKLQLILEYAKINNYNQILSFGGAFSNHIHALALLAKQYSIDSVGFIRGEAHYVKNPTLRDAQNAGMKLEFISRSEYKKRNDPKYLLDLQQRYPNALIIPEGGSSQLAVSGCAQMARDIQAPKTNQSNTILTIASGTGATAAGLACGLSDDQQLNAYSVLKDESLKARIDNFINENQVEPHDPRYSLYGADFGGYAKFDKPLLDFILNWLDQTGVLLDPIYTSKMCRRVVQQIEAGEFTHGTSITLIHSGGLQGWRGMQTRTETLGGATAWKKIENLVTQK